MEKYQYVAIFFLLIEKKLYFCSGNRNILVLWT